MKENYEFIKTKVAFKCHPNGRTPGTFTDYDSLDDKIDGLYYYMQFIKFGFGRASRDASRLIHNGQLSRDEGLKLAGKFLKTSFQASISTRFWISRTWTSLNLQKL